MEYEVRNTRTGQIISQRAVMADSPWSRMRGLLGRRSLPPGEAIILRPAASIHTLFMRFPIDVIYLDRDQRVAKVVRNLAPFRFSSARRAHFAIEMAAGGTEGVELQRGDRLELHALSAAGRQR